MSVELNLSAETERILKQKAARAGQTLEGFLQGLAEREAATQNGSPPRAAPLTAEEWSAKWRAWASADRRQPSGLIMDDSREGIYAGRGE
jgi:phosphohistidine phosphatase SixA